MNDRELLVVIPDGMPQVWADTFTAVWKDGYVGYRDSRSKDRVVPDDEKLRVLKAIEVAKIKLNSYLAELEQARQLLLK